MPTDVGPVQPPARSASTRAPVAKDSGARRAPGAAPAPTVKSDALRLAVAPPIDADRVAMIRRAIANDTYPILPMQVADAIIGASVMLSIGRSSSSEQAEAGR
jgi:negative regulator of flagellin synthesis FlgM